MLYCCLLVMVQPLFLAWADLHHTNSLWALFQRSIVEFRLGYPIFYLGTSEIFPPTKVIVEKSLRLDFSATNNEAEYETLMMGMTMVQRMGGKSVKVFSDSRLVVGQVKGEFEVKDERL